MVDFKQIVNEISVRQILWKYDVYNIAQLGEPYKEHLMVLKTNKQTNKKDQRKRKPCTKTSTQERHGSVAIIGLLVCLFFNRLRCRQHQEKHIKTTISADHLSFYWQPEI